MRKLLREPLFHFLLLGALIFAATRGRWRRAGGADPIGAAPAAEARPFAAPIGSATHTPQPPPVPDDDFAAIYLFLIDALDRGLERGEFSKESHALIRGNLKRRLEAILSDQPLPR